MSALYYSHSKRRGFTFLEVIVVVAIIGIISGISLMSYVGTNKKQALEKDAAKVAAVYEEARALSVGAKNGSSFGVHAEASKIVRFTGSTYTVGNSGNIEDFLSPYVTISDVVLSGGGSDVVFSKIGGTTTKSGIIKLELISDPIKTKKIIIYTTGLVEVKN